MELTFKLSELREVTRLNTAGEKVKVTENVQYEILNDAGENIGNMGAHTNGLNLSITAPVGPSFSAESLIGQLKNILTEDAE